MRLAPLVFLGLVLTAPVAGSTEAPGASLGDEEVLEYRWSLGGFKGAFARLVLPGRGDAVLRTGTHGNGHLVSELHITSPRSRRGEFWRYRAEIEAGGEVRTLRAWTEQFFRGRAKERQADLAAGEALDIPSTIYRLRQESPERPLETRIWSDGKLYPVRIELGRRRGHGAPRRVAGRTVSTRSYSVVGVDRPGERKWKGRLDLVLADDPGSTPVEIALVQRGLKVRLELVGDEGGRS